MCPDIPLVDILVTQLRAELNAYYSRLYGLTRDELRYILDPKEVYGEDFPGETFRVLKEKEVKQFSVSAAVKVPNAREIGCVATVRAG